MGMMIDTLPAVQPPPVAKRIALLFNQDYIHGQEIIAGVAAYLRSIRLPWLVFVSHDYQWDVSRLDSLRCDGIIADFDNPEVRAAIQGKSVPVVGVGSSFDHPDDYPRDISYVATDDFALIKLAYDHLIDVGLTHFALLSVPNAAAQRWSTMRENAFRKLVQRDRASAQIHRGRDDASLSWDETTAQLVAWVATLPKPVGIIVVADWRAKQLLQACQIAGVAVPEEVAVVSIDASPLYNGLTRISLSSVRQGAQQIGREAGQLLHQRLSGGATQPHRQVFVAPAGLVVNASSQHEAIVNAHVMRGRYFIRQHACQGIKTEQVADYVGISRSALDRVFKAELGRSVHDEILRFKLDAARSVLAEGGCSVAEVAVNCGFTSLQYMYKVFNREMGCTPRAYQLSLLQTDPREPG